MQTDNFNRRDFLTTTGLLGVGTAVPYFFSMQRSLAEQLQTKNERPTLGLIGCGSIVNYNMVAAMPYLDVAAIAEVDRNRGKEGAKKYSGGKADIYTDYREVINRDDIDLIHIATPDHWHTKILIEAMLAGKDVYCEKPMTLTIDEGKLICKVQKQTGRIVQVGTQQRSSFDLFTKAVAMVAEGRVGKIRRIVASIDGGRECESIPTSTPPKELDWNAWLGPAPEVDFRSGEVIYKKDNKRHHASNCHGHFRWWYEFSGGKLTDWGAHHIDIAVWALQANGQTGGPLSIKGNAVHPVDFVEGMPLQKDRYNTATSFDFKVAFPGGTELIITSKPGNGVLIEGDKGRIFVNRRRLTGKPVEQLKNNPLPEDAISQVYKGLPLEEDERRGHWVNFIHCARNQKEPISDVHSHMQALNICHLAGICARLGREIEWDASTEQIVGDEQANSFMSRSYRNGYTIEM